MQFHAPIVLVAVLSLIPLHSFAAKIDCPTVSAETHYHTGSSADASEDSDGHCTVSIDSADKSSAQAPLLISQALHTCSGTYLPYAGMGLAGAGYSYSPENIAHILADIVIPLAIAERFRGRSIYTPGIGDYDSILRTLDVPPTWSDNFQDRSAQCKDWIDSIAHNMQPLSQGTIDLDFNIEEDSGSTKSCLEGFYSSGDVSDCPVVIREGNFLIVRLHYITSAGRYVVQLSRYVR